MLPTELVIEIIKLARELDDRKFLEYIYHEYLRRYTRGNPEFRLSREPRGTLPTELVIEMIKLAREFDDRVFLEYIYREYLRRYMVRDPEFGLSREPRGTLPMELVIEMIKLAREFDDQGFLKTFYHEYLKEKIQHEIDSMPLYALKDIYWLAKKFNNKKILFEIDKKINDGIIWVTNKAERTTIEHQSVAPQVENTPSRRNKHREHMSEKSLLSNLPEVDEAARKRSKEDMDSTEL